MLRFIDSLPSETKEFFKSLDSLPFRNVRELDLGNASFCAEASALTYKSDEFIDELAGHLRPNGWEVFRFSAEPTSCVLLRNDQIAVLAFRGTRVAGFPDLLRQVPINLQDLTTDFSVQLLPHPKNGRVHAGFFGAFNNFWTTHRGEILALMGGRSLYVTGHSLGGALATVAARDIEVVAALYTFGSPRVGDEVFRLGFESLRLPVYRFVHSADLVTTVPLEEMDYRHVGDLLHLAGGDAFSVRREQQHSLLGSFAHNIEHFPENFGRFLENVQLGRLWNLPDYLLPEDSLADHSPNFYTRKLSRAAMIQRECIFS